MIKPHTLFNYWSADEVAECLDGVPNELYHILWSITKVVSNTPGLDYREVPDSFDHCLGRPGNGWEKLAGEHQLLLNSLAKRYQQTDQL